MATLTPTLTLSSADATVDNLSFTVTDTLTVKHPHVGLSKVSATTTGGDTVIVPSVDVRRFLFVRHTGVDTSGSDVTTTLKVEEGDGNWFSLLSPGEFLWVPINANGAQAIQLEASGGTIVAEYAYWTKA